MWTLRGYTVERLLGAGGSSEVWRARVTGSGDPVALKRMPLPDAARARAEAAKLSVLDHPHLVRLHALVPTKDASVLVLDLAEGGSLADLLAVRGRLAPGEVITAISPVAAALAYLHNAGVVHGDVSAANILFTPGGIPLLADLGVARLTGEEDPAQSTFAYLDPLVADGCVPAAASDVFMLAAVALHALTGEPPWPGPPDEALVAARAGELGDVAARLRALAVPDAVARVVVRALQRDPVRRGTAADLALELRHSGTPLAVELAAGRARDLPAGGVGGDALGRKIAEAVGGDGDLPAHGVGGDALGRKIADTGIGVATAWRAGLIAAGQVIGAPPADGSRRRFLFRRTRPDPAPPGPGAPATPAGSGDAAPRTWTGPRHAAVVPPAPPTRSIGPRPRPTLPAPGWRVRVAKAVLSRAAALADYLPVDPGAARRVRRAAGALGAVAVLGLIAALVLGLVGGLGDGAGPGHRGARASGVAAVGASSPPAGSSVAGTLGTTDRAGPPGAESRTGSALPTVAGPRPSPVTTRGAPSTSAGPAPTGAAAWAQRLATLDAVRAEAFAARRPELLTQVYLPGPLLTADTRLLLRLVPQGCGLVGALTTYRPLGVRVIADGAEVTTVAALPASRLVCPGRPETTAAGAAGPVRLRVRLARAEGGWRIADQVSV